MWSRDIRVVPHFRIIVTDSATDKQRFTKVNVEGTYQVPITMSLKWLQKREI